MYESLLSSLHDHQIEYKENFQLSNISSFKTGGPADIYIVPKNPDEILYALQACQADHIPYTVIGNASNLLISDKGVRGAVIRLGNSFSKLTYLGDGKIHAQAGASLSALCNFALKNSLTGLEFAFGIPGTAGGAAYMNAGAYGGEMKDVLLSCSHITPDLQSQVFCGDELKLSYRKSVYTDSSNIITGLTIQLHEGNPIEIKAKMDDFFQRRKSKQPLEFPSAGSTFKRPEGYFAGALIEECGLKGFSFKGAQVSEKHAGFVINKDHATTSDIISLMEQIVKIVEQRKGVRLEPEVKYIGEK